MDEELEALRREAFFLLAQEDVRHAFVAADADALALAEAEADAVAELILRDAQEFERRADEA